MARNGLLYEDVAGAATYVYEELKSKNDNISINDVTIEKVRNFLQRGSATTISRHLKAWREQGTVISPKIELPAHVSELLTQMFNQMKQEANLKMAEIEEDAHRVKEEAHQTVEAFKAENHRLTQELGQGSLTIQDLTFERDTLLPELTGLKRDYGTLIEQLQAKKTEIERLETFNHRLEDNLRHFHEMSEKHRMEQELKIENERASWNQEKQALQLQLMDSKSDLHLCLTKAEEMKEQVNGLMEKNQLLEEKLEYNQKIINDKNSELMTQSVDLMELTRLLESLQKENEGYKINTHAMKSQFEENEKMKNELVLQLQRSNTTIEALSRRNLELANERIESAKSVLTTHS